MSAVELTEQEYHADPCETPSLSSGIAKLICNDSPLHAWTAHPRLNTNWQPEDTKERDFGTIAHALLLQGENKAVILTYDDYRKNEARQARDDARAHGKIPILEKDWARVEPMLKACRRQIESHKDAKNAFTNGAPERSLLWKEENGVWCRARLDWLHADLRFIDDLKTRNATANPDPLSRTLFAEGWDLQAAFYIRGVRKVYPEANPIFRFVCLETYEPYALSVIALAPDALMLADRRIERAIEIFGECLKTGYWPGYPDRTCYATVPAWMEHAQMEKELREAL